MKILYLILLPLIIYFTSVITEKYSLLLSQSGENHQRFAEKKNIPLIGGFFVLLNYLILFYGNFNLFNFFLILIFFLGLFSDIKLIKSPVVRFLSQTIIIFLLVIFNDLSINYTRIIFLDYFATGKLDNDILEEVVKGFSIACKENSCVLIGGETAEMPGFYDNNKYDLSGTIVGVVDKDEMMPNRKVESGNLLVGLKSTGLHTNGYSLARKVLFNHYKIGEYVAEIDSTIENELLKIHKSYFPLLEGILKNKWLKSISHITGGGIVENTLRVVDDDYDININWDTWEMNNIFKLIMEKGNVPIADMRRTFNLGIGLILIINENHLDDLKSHLNIFNEECIVIGDVVAK